MKYIRWLLAVGCFAACAWLIFTALKSAEVVAAASALADSADAMDAHPGAKVAEPLPYYVLAVVAFLAGIFLFVPELVGQMVGAVGNALSGLILPNARNAKPILTYTLAHRYVETERFAEAVEEYRKIIHYYPKEKDAYVELLSAAVQGGDMKTYKKYARLLKKRFNCEIELSYADDPATVEPEGSEPPVSSEDGPGENLR